MTSRKARRRNTASAERLAGWMSRRLRRSKTRASMGDCADRAAALSKVGLRARSAPTATPAAVTARKIATGDKRIWRAAVVYRCNPLVGEKFWFSALEQCAGMLGGKENKRANGRGLAPPVSALRSDGQAGRPVLLSDDDDVEAVGEGLRAGRLLAFLGCRGGAVFGGPHVDVVGGGVDGHGAGAALGGHGVHGFILAVDRFDNGHGAVAVGAKGQAGIEARAIGAGTNRWGGDHLHGGDIGDGHHLVAAHAEQLLVLDVDGQAGRAFARGQRGAAGHAGLGGVDLHDFARVLDIDIELACAIYYAVFGFFADRETADDLIVLGVDGG